MDTKDVWKMLAEIRQLAQINRKILARVVTDRTVPIDVLPVLVAWYEYNGIVANTLTEKLGIAEAILLEETMFNKEEHHTTFNQIIGG